MCMLSILYNPIFPFLVPEMVDDNNNEVPCEMNAGSDTVVDKNDNETDCQKTEISPEKNTTTHAQDDKVNTVCNPRR